MAPWHDVPPELLVHSLRTLPMQTIANVTMVCHGWKNAISGDQAATVDAIIKDAALWRYPKLLDMPDAATTPIRVLYCEFEKSLREPSAWRQQGCIGHPSFCNVYNAVHKPSGTFAVIKKLRGDEEGLDCKRPCFEPAPLAWR